MIALKYDDALRMPVSALKKYLNDNGCKGYAVALAPKHQLVKWATMWSPFDHEWHLKNGYDRNGKSLTETKEVPKTEPPKTETKTEDPMTETKTETKPGSLEEILAGVLAGHLTPQVEKIVNNYLQNAGLATTIKLDFGDGKTKEIKGHTHKEFPRLLKMANIALQMPGVIYPWIAGPAGGGKSTVMQNVAEALDLPFYYLSGCAQTTKTDFFGFTDAQSRLVKTAFRECYENGGVFLLDEVDAINPNILVMLNNALSARCASFPDGMVKMSDRCIVAAAANTWGRGADAQYVGRQTIDLASIDRFQMVPFDYDEALEKAITGNDEWVKRVQRIRKAIFDKKEKIIASPRASRAGAALLAAGFLQSEVEDMVIWKGVNPEVKQRVLAAC